MPTNRENAQFTSAIIGDELLDNAIEWIKRSQAVQDVFDDDDILDYVKGNYDPEDVFPEAELDAWAIENGYSKA